MAWLTLLDEILLRDTGVRAVDFLTARGRLGPMYGEVQWTMLLMLILLANSQLRAARAAGEAALASCEHHFAVRAALCCSTNLLSSARGTRVQQA